MSRRSLYRRLSLFVSSRARRGQSLVEFTVLLPVLLIMISGVIEFGFMLNYYLDLIDAAREATRWGAGDDPVHDLSGTWDDPNESFYLEVQDVALDSINIGSGGQISLDPASDDIVISAFSVSGGTITARFPGGPCTCGTGYGEDGLSLYGNHGSDFTTAEVQALLDPSAPNTGIVMVEIWYDYHMLLGLPWITAFVPDPVGLYAYTMMPNPNVEPTPTP
jgi:hypothetical protein